MTEKLPVVHGAYVPRSDEKFRRWAFVLTGRIAQDPAAAGVSEQHAQELSAAYNVFSDLFDASRKRSTRTLDLVGRKNTARKILESMCRKVAQRIKHDENVSFEFKSVVFRRGKHRRKCAGSPGTAPTLHVTGMKSGRHELRWQDESVPWTRRKPKGAAGLQLFAVVADRAVMDWSRLQYVRTYTKQPMKVSWPHETAGMVVMYVGRWINAKGEEGPWSDPVPIQVAFAGPVLMQIDRAQQVAAMQQMRRAA